MSESRTWKQALGARIPEAWGREIDVFETQIELRKRGKIEEKLFAETRLRRGAYGQRYDNGQRHDGEKTQTLVFPLRRHHQGPQHDVGRARDAADQDPVRAGSPPTSWTCSPSVAEEYSDAHPARHDPPGLPAALRPHRGHARHARGGWPLSASRRARRAATRSATSPPARIAGVCRTEAFDVTPYAHALTFFLLGHPDTQDFGRKFKVAFSGCEQNACGLTNFHDLGAIARTREDDGETSAASSWYVGGGLGAVPQQAQAVRRVPARGGAAADRAGDQPRVRAPRREERTARARASSSWSRSWASRSSSAWCSRSAPSCAPDPRWTAFLADLHAHRREAAAPGRQAAGGALPRGLRRLARDQRHAAAPGRLRRWRRVTLPLGDLTREQARALGRRRPQVHGRHHAHHRRAEHAAPLGQRGRPARRSTRRSKAIGLADAGRRDHQRHHAPARAPTRASSASRRRAGWRPSCASSSRESGIDKDPNAQAACTSRPAAASTRAAQHHVADLGFLGVSRNVGGRRVPHFQLVVGGQWTNNGGAYGLAIGAVPVEARPRGRQAHDRALRQGAPGRRDLRRLRHPHRQEDDPRDGRGAAGAARPTTRTRASTATGATRASTRSPTWARASARARSCRYVEFEPGGAPSASCSSRSSCSTRASSTAPPSAPTRAMLQAARALAREKNPNLGSDAGRDRRASSASTSTTRSCSSIRSRVGSSRSTSSARTRSTPSRPSQEAAHQIIEEATLFVDAAHQCYTRLGSALRNPTVTAPAGA